jgi:hypothetical protein
MRTMSFDRIYDRALARAYESRIEVHSLALEVNREGMTRSLQRAIKFWEEERRAADVVLAALIEVCGRHIQADTTAELDEVLRD